MFFKDIFVIYCSTLEYCWLHLSRVSMRFSAFTVGSAILGVVVGLAIPNKQTSNAGIAPCSPDTPKSLVVIFESDDFRSRKQFAQLQRDLPDHLENVQQSTQEGNEQKNLKDLQQLRQGARPVPRAPIVEDNDIELTWSPLTSMGRNRQYLTAEMEIDQQNLVDEAKAFMEQKRNVYGIIQVINSFAEPVTKAIPSNNRNRFADLVTRNSGKPSHLLITFTNKSLTPEVKYKSLRDDLEKYLGKSTETEWSEKLEQKGELDNKSYKAKMHDAEQKRVDKAEAWLEEDGRMEKYNIEKVEKINADEEKRSIKVRDDKDDEDYRKNKLKLAERRKEPHLRITFTDKQGQLGNLKDKIQKAIKKKELDIGDINDDSWSENLPGTTGESRMVLLWIEKDKFEAAKAWLEDETRKEKLGILVVEEGPKKSEKRTDEDEEGDRNVEEQEKMKTPHLRISLEGMDRHGQEDKLKKTVEEAVKAKELDIGEYSWSLNPMTETRGGRIILLFLAEDKLEVARKWLEDKKSKNELEITNVKDWKSNQGTFSMPL